MIWWLFMGLEHFPQELFQLDSAHLLEHYATLTADIKEAYALGETIGVPRIKESVDQIFILGMGGSAISGDVLRIWLDEIGCKLPVHVVRDYSIPAHMTAQSLVFAISYSGNTEETLSAYRKAMRITKNTVSLSSGGKLKETSTLSRLAHLPVPKGFEPRTAALSYLLFPLIKILERLDIIPSQRHAIDRLTNDLVKPDFKKIAISMSAKLEGKIPLVYASQRYFPLAYRCKTQLNENAKIHAFAGAYSEINHNELLAYTHSQEKYHVLCFIMDSDHRRIKKRMTQCKELTQKANGATTEIKLSGPSFLTKLFSGFIIGDLTAYYLGLRYREDPSQVKLIESFKKKMGTYIAN
ncbi:MAG: bifunctional phosphoglucose/phosphomannose isomerase [Candidatus Nanoarchaeia archaeon]